MPRISPNKLKIKLELILPMMDKEKLKMWRPKTEKNSKHKSINKRD